MMTEKTISIEERNSFALSREIMLVSYLSMILPVQLLHLV